MAIYSTYVFAGCIVSIMLNLFFLIVTHIRRVEGFQEVLVFVRNISVGYILMALCLLAIAPQSITFGTSIIRIPFGKLEYFDTNFLNIISSIGCGFFLYTIICFCIMFFYRYNVTCKTSTLSTVFSRKNILVFLIAAGIFCFIQSVLIYYSAVDATYLREKYNKIQEDREPLASDVPEKPLPVAISSVSLLPASTSSPQDINANEGQQIHAPINVGQSMSYVQDASKKTIFGLDFQRNPMIFLSLGIYTVTIILSSIAIVAISVVVYCKLNQTENYGKESMSGKSKDEQIMLTKILMLTAYIPIILAAILGANFLVCFIRQKSMPFQELLVGFVVPWIAIAFPVLTILLIPALRYTAFQIITCHIWKADENSGDSDLNGNTINNSRMAVRENEVDGKLSDDQLRALSNLTR